MLGNKLAWWLGLGSGGQWSYIQLAASRKLCFPGPTKYCRIIFINDLDKGMTCTFISLRMMPCWERALISCLRVGRLCIGMWTGWITGPRPVTWGSTRLSVSPALGSLHSEPRQLHRLGENCLESCPAEKQLGMLLDSLLNMGQVAKKTNGLLCKQKIRMHSKRLTTLGLQAQIQCCVFTAHLDSVFSSLFLVLVILFNAPLKVKWIKLININRYQIMKRIFINHSFPRGWS